MATSLNVIGNPSANQRLLVSRSGSHAIEPGADGDVQAVLQLRRPSLGERFGRSVANFFTLGWYTKNQNRQEWAEFKRIALSGALQNLEDDFGVGELATTHTKSLIERAMAQYDGKRLTQARAQNVLAEIQSNVLAEIQSKRNGAVPKERVPEMLDAKTNVVARAWRTMKQNLRSLNQREADLREYAQRAVNNKPAETKVRGPADSMLSVLKPGRQISSYAIEHGQKALTKYAQQKDVVFRSHDISNNICNSLNDLPKSEPWLAIQGHEGSGKHVLLAVPLQLTEGNLGHEPHSVLLTIDPMRKQITYFDAKADSMTDAGKNYGNVNGDLETTVKALGNKLFGEHWKAQTGLLSLTIPKQQGSNDCGVFTHEFTRRMIDGESLGDIERSFTADDRKKMRADMADDIRKHLIGDDLPITQADSDPKAAGAQALPDATAPPSGAGAQDRFELL